MIELQCFMNSVLQCLSNTRAVLDYVISEEYTRNINTTTSSMNGALIKGSRCSPLASFVFRPLHFNVKSTDPSLDHPSTIPRPSLNHPSTIPQPSILQMGKRNVHHPRGSFEGSWRRSWQESQPERSLEGFRQSLTNQSYKWAREMSISLERILRGIISKILTRILETIPSESLKDPWKDPVRIPKNPNDDMPIEPDRWLRTNNEAKPPLNWSMNTSWMNLTRVNQLTN